MPRPMQFVTNCVNANGGDIRAMVDSATSIERSTFLRYVDRDQLRELEKSLGYSVGHERGLHMSNDWAVSYHKSTYRGRPCRYFCWSAIEYIFCHPTQG